MTHSVANCVKRVVVIVASVIFFSTPISPVNALGNFDQCSPKNISQIIAAAAACCPLQALFFILAKSLTSAVLAAGTGAALGGVFLYSRLTRKKPKSA